MEEGLRLADEGIYLNEDRFTEPKEMFKFIFSVLPHRFQGNMDSLLDVGCATGELIHFFRTRFPALHCMGVDVSEEMIEKARQIQPEVVFSTGDLRTGLHTDGREFDLVCSVGVLQIFDDIVEPIKNLLGAVKAGGCLCIAGSFNNHNIDVLMRYRAGGDRRKMWETGWNLFSQQTVEDTLLSIKKNISIRWYDFEMPFPLLEQVDPMRSWTIQTETNRHQLVNGAAQLLFTKVLVVQDLG